MTQPSHTRLFPIMSEWDYDSHKQLPSLEIPWEMMAKHEEQAIDNHYGQTLEVLARRGGLSRKEAMAAISNMSLREFWKLPVSAVEAGKELEELTALWNQRSPGNCSGMKEGSE